MSQKSSSSDNGNFWDLPADNPWASATIFDFNKNWDLVLPHLCDEDLQFRLRTGINAYIHQASPELNMGTEYDPLMGPWMYSTSDRYWENLYWTAQDALSYDKILCSHGHELGGEESDECQSCTDLFEEWECKFHPRPGTYQWYQLTEDDNGQWLIPWQVKLGELMFPDLNWEGMFGVMHSVAIGRDSGGQVKMIFDIVYFGMSFGFIFKQVTTKSSKEEGDSVQKRGAELLKICDPKSGKAEPSN